MFILFYVCKIYNHELLVKDLAFSLQPSTGKGIKSKGPCIGEGKSFAFSVYGKQQGCSQIWTWFNLAGHERG